MAGRFLRGDKNGRIIDTAELRLADLKDDLEDML